jgi:hypothetical protein
MTELDHGDIAPITGCMEQPVVADTAPLDISGLMTRIADRQRARERATHNPRTHLSAEAVSVDGLDRALHTPHTHSA